MLSGRRWGRGSEDVEEPSGQAGSEGGEREPRAQEVSECGLWPPWLRMLQREQMGPRGRPSWKGYLK